SIGAELLALTKTVLDGPLYRRRIPPGAGLSVIPGTKAEVVIHCTHTKPGSADNIINARWNNLGAGMPHFFGNQPDDFVQTLPLNVGAYTLENPTGGIDTNRGGVYCIQIEICEYAENAHVWGKAGSPWMRAIARWLA